MSEKTTLTVETVPDLFAATDAQDAERMAGYFHDDVVLISGNGDPIHGVDNHVATLTGFAAELGGLRHELHKVWSVEDGKYIVIVMTVHCTRKDGTTVSVPGVDVLEVEDGLIRLYQTYMDAAPVFA
jgi:ketosteroid isomerase-like protein